MHKIVNLCILNDWPNFECYKSDTEEWSHCYINKAEVIFLYKECNENCRLFDRLTSGKQNKLIQFANDDIINNKTHHLIETYTNTVHMLKIT